MNHPLPNLQESKTELAKLKLAFISAGLSHLGEAEAAHSKLVRSAVDGGLKELKRIGIETDTQLIHVNVPGVLEIPLMAQKLIEEHKVDGIVGFALIVNGEIYRHEFVAQASLDAFMNVSLETKVPMASCLLTPVQPRSPETQFDMLKEHLHGKGEETTRALLQQILQLRKV